MKDMVGFVPPAQLHPARYSSLKRDYYYRGILYIVTPAIRLGRGHRVVVSIWDVGAGNPGSLPVQNANSGIPHKVDYSSLGRWQ